MTKLTRERHSTEGLEILDPRPMQPPLGYKKQPSLAEQIRQQVIAAKLEELDHLMETEEEADDFAIEDEMGPYSPHENEGMPTIRELKAKVEEINAEIKRQNLEALREQLKQKQGGASAPQSDLPSNVKASGEPASVKGESASGP